MGIYSTLTMTREQAIKLLKNLHLDQLSNEKLEDILFACGSNFGCTEHNYSVVDDEYKLENDYFNLGRCKKSEEFDIGKCPYEECLKGNVTLDYLIIDK